VFGIVSPLLAIGPACANPWRKKWRAFVHFATKMSHDHIKTVVQGADFVETFECVSCCRPIGKHMLINYYKLGHSMSSLLLLFCVTLIKFAALSPLLSGICCLDDGKDYLIDKDKKKGNQMTRLSTKNGSKTDDMNEDEIEDEQYDQNHTSNHEGAYGTNPPSTTLVVGSNRNDYGTDKENNDQKKTSKAEKSFSSGAYD